MASEPAFPTTIAYHPLLETMAYGEGGMTLRDYFAAQELVAMGTWVPSPSAIHGTPGAHKARARHAYAMADAMLAAREAGDGE